MITLKTELKIYIYKHNYIYIHNTIYIYTIYINNTYIYRKYIYIYTQLYWKNTNSV